MRTTILVLLMTGCMAYPDTVPEGAHVIVDMKGVDEQQYKIDLKECQNIAEKALPNTLKGTFISDMDLYMVRYRVIAPCLKGRGYSVLD